MPPNPQSRQEPPPQIPDHDLNGLVGRGSYGEVWLAENLWGKARAVKVMDAPDEGGHGHGAGQRELAGLERYRPLCRSALGLVRIYESGWTKSGRFFYVMELAENASLDGRYVPRTLRLELDRRGRLPVAECLRLGTMLARALATLHEAGLVHRDVKPANIICVLGEWKLADVGLVTGLDEARTLVGTEGYIPMEGPGRAQADLYALGKVLYECVTGQPHDEYPRLPEKWMEAGHEAEFEFMEVVLRACEGDAERRYASATEVQADLALLSSGRSVRRVRQLERRSARLKKLGLVAVALAVVAGVGAVYQGRRTSEESALRQRAEQAEARARQELFLAELATAAADRRSGASGARGRAIAAAVRAGKIQPDSEAARSEAVAALAVADLRVMDRWQAERPARLDGRFLTRFSHDTSLLAVSQLNGSIQLTDTWTGEARGTFAAVGRRILRVGPFSPNAQWLAVAYEGGPLRLWPLDARLAPVDLGAEEEEGVIFSPDGRFLLTCLADGTAIEREPPEWTETKRIKLWFNPIAAQFNPSGTQVAVCPRHGAQVFVFDVDTEKPLRVLDHPVPFHPRVLAWTPDGRGLAVGGTGSAIFIWNLADGAARPELIRGHQGDVVGLAWHPKLPVLASSSADRTTRLWNTLIGLELASCPVWGGGLLFSPDGKRLALDFADSDQAMRLGVELPEVYETLLDASTPRGGPMVREQGAWDAAFSPDGRWIAVTTGQQVAVYDAATRRRAGGQPVEGRAEVHFAVNPPALLVLDESGWRKWPLREGAGETVLGPPARLPDWPGLATHPAVSGDGATVADLDPAGHPRVRRADGSVLGFDSRARPPLYLSEDGSRISIRYEAEKGEPAGMGLFSTELPQLVTALPWAESSCQAFPADGSPRVAIAARDAVSVFDTASGTTVWRYDLAGDAGMAEPVAWSATGSLIAAVTGAQEIGLFDAGTGRLLTRLEHRMQHVVTRVVFSPDGGALVVTCANNTVHYWDLRAMRTALAAQGLDWGRGTPPPPPPAHAAPRALRFTAE